MSGAGSVWTIGAPIITLNYQVTGTLVTRELAADATTTSPLDLTSAPFGNVLFSGVGYGDVVLDPSDYTIEVFDSTNANVTTTATTSGLGVGDYTIKITSILNEDYVMGTNKGELTLTVSRAAGSGETGGETGGTTVDAIINAIASGIAVQPPVIPTFTPPAPPTPAPQQFSFGGQPVQLMSTPNGGTPTQVVTMQEIRQMQQDGGNGGGNPGEIRIPLMQGSLIDLVNGGVKLPENVEQEFFMAQR